MENAFVGIAAAILVNEQREHDRLAEVFRHLGRVGEVASAMENATAREKTGRTIDDDRQDYAAGVAVGEARVLADTYRAGRSHGARAALAEIQNGAPDRRKDPTGFLKSMRERLAVKAD